MKILILFLIFTLTTFAQSWNLLWEDPFDPFDNNTIAVWDGDDIAVPNWADDIGAENLQMFNTPTTGTLNGHTTVIFNGSDEYAENTSLAVNSPYSIYLVIRQITWANSDYMAVDDGGGSAFILQQSGISPAIQLDDPVGTPSTSSQLLLNTWGVVSIITTNNLLKFLRVNLNSSISSPSESNNFIGIDIGSTEVPSQFGNIEVAYIIVRNTADSNPVQNSFINWLKTRFGI